MVRLPGMSNPRSVRRRPTEVMREAARLTDAVAASLGRSVKVARRRLGLTQEALGARVGVHQSWISRIELGRGQEVPLSLWIRLGIVLGQPLAVSFSRPLGHGREPTDAGHLAIQDQLLWLARQTSRHATFELPTRPADPSRSIDVCVRDARHRVLLIEEAWNTFGDIGAAIRVDASQRGRGRGPRGDDRRRAAIPGRDGVGRPRQRGQSCTPGPISGRRPLCISRAVARLGHRPHNERGLAGHPWPGLVGPRHATHPRMAREDDLALEPATSGWRPPTNGSSACSSRARTSTDHRPSPGWRCPGAA